MNQEGHDLVSVLGFSIRVKIMILSSYSPHDNWVNAFQMWWIGKNLNSEIISIWVCLGVVSTQMVFHVTRMWSVLVVFQIGWCHALELSENDV
jgi:hypothetical protein